MRKSTNHLINHLYKKTTNRIEYVIHWIIFRSIFFCGTYLPIWLFLCTFIISKICANSVLHQPSMFTAMNLLYILSQTQMFGQFFWSAFKRNWAYLLAYFGLPCVTIGIGQCLEFNCPVYAAINIDIQQEHACLHLSTALHLKFHVWKPWQLQILNVVRALIR